MKVLLTISEFGMTGAVIAFLDIARFLIETGNKVSVWSSRAAIDASPDMVQRFVALGAEVISHAVVEEYDAMVADPIMAPKSILNNLGKCPILGWVGAGRVGVRMAFENIEIAQALNSVHRLIFPTQDTAQGYFSFLHRYPQDRISIIPCAVRPAEDCLPVPKAAGKIRILFVGSIYPRKRPEDLIMAVADLRDPALECIMVGEIFHLAAESKQIVADNPKTFAFQGPVAPRDLQRLYRSTDIFCLPSEDESFGMASMEVAAHGVPVILSDLGCYEGMWRHGRNCLMHPVGDVPLLSALIKLLIDAPDVRQRLGNEGAKLARYYTYQRFSALFAIALNDAISCPRKPGETLA